MNRRDRGAFRELLRENIISYYNNNIFSSASISLCYKNGGCSQKNRLTVEYGGEKKDFPVSGGTIFDLASLTKPLVTLLCLLNLIDTEELQWSDTVGDILGGGSSEAVNRVSIEMLASHSSGLPAHRDYSESLLEIPWKCRKKWLLDKLLHEPIKSHEEGLVLYSDLGYMLLGFVVEKITGQSLDTYWLKTIARPIDIEQALFFPIRDKTSGNTYAATGRCRTTGQRLAGIVHDDNCRSLGGVCGHAGLFGSSAAVLRLTEELLALYLGEETALPIGSTTFRRACMRVASSDWSRGFQLPTPGKSSSGSYFSQKSFGHLGFTGTSFWIDPLRQLIVVLLTNRVVKGVDRSGIQKMRPELHDSVVQYLEERERV